MWIFFEQFHFEYQEAVIFSRETIMTTSDDEAVSQVFPAHKFHPTLKKNPGWLLFSSLTRRKSRDLNERLSETIPHTCSFRAELAKVYLQWVPMLALLSAHTFHVTLLVVIFVCRKQHLWRTYLPCWFQSQGKVWALLFFPIETFPGHICVILMTNPHHLWCPFVSVSKAAMINRLTFGNARTRYSGSGCVILPQKPTSENLIVLDCSLKGKRPALAILFLVLMPLACRFLQPVFALSSVLFLRGLRLSHIYCCQGFELRHSTSKVMQALLC